MSVCYPGAERVWIGDFARAHLAIEYRQVRLHRVSRRGAAFGEYADGYVPFRYAASHENPMEAVRRIAEFAGRLPKPAAVSVQATER